jgi:hypothetical protein
MKGKPGPFQARHLLSVTDADTSANPPERQYDCKNYDTCLNLAAALNWESFTCDGCTGDVDESLCWRAHQAEKKDKLIGRICDLPELTYTAPMPPLPDGTNRKVGNK